MLCQKDNIFSSSHLFFKKKVPSRNLQENCMSLRKPQIDGYEMQLRKAIQNNVFGITECASQHLL